MGNYSTDWEVSENCKPNLIPDITDEQIREMLHIEPIMHVMGDKYAKLIYDNQTWKDIINNSYLWDVKEGDTLWMDSLNRVDFITYHTYGYYGFFKPSIREVYAQIRANVPNWHLVKYFCLFNEDVDVKNIIGPYHFCKCSLFGKELDV